MGDLFAPGAASLFVLTAMRTGGLLMVAPVFSARVIPAPLRIALIVLFTLLVQPAAAGSPTLTPASVLGETLVGFVIGLGAALLIGAAEGAGELLSLQIGLSGAALFDPLSLQQTTALGQLMQLFVLTLVLASNGHLLMIGALGESLRTIPIGAALDTASGFRAAVAAGGSLFSLGLQFASPVVAVVLVANVALAVLSRAAPQLNILQLAFPVQILVGFSAVLVGLPYIASWFLGWEVSYGTMVSRLLGALVPAR